MLILKAIKGLGSNCRGKQLISLLTIVVVAMAPELSAQSKDDGIELSEGRTSAKSRMIEEVIVTAQKRSENAQDVPISLVAFSEQVLDAKGIDSPEKLAQFTPGMYYGQTVNFSVIYIRGIGTDAFLPDSDPSVAAYIDGIYYPFANGQAQSFGAVERIEVLKGPQGTLFGRNSTGGAINIITKTPSAEPELALQASQSSFNTNKLRAYINIPVGESVAAGISWIRQRSDGYYKGTRGDGQGGITSLPEEVIDGFRYRLRLSPVDDLDIVLSHIDYEQYGLGSSGMVNIAPSSLGELTGIEKPASDYRVAIDVPGYFSMSNKVYYGELEWRTRYLDVKILASHQDIVTDNYFDADGSDTPFLTFDAKGQYADVKTAEIQLISNDSSPTWIEWIAGAYYLDQASGFPLNRLSALGADISDGALLGIPISRSLLDLLQNLGPVPDGASLGLVSLLGTESLAYFGQTTVHFNHWLHLTLGGRYQHEDRRVIESSMGLVNLDGSRSDLIQFRRPEKSTENFSPKLALKIDVSENAMVYGSYTRGYKSGTFNTTNVYNQPEYVSPEVVDTWELGMKSTFNDGALELNMALFLNEIEDLQVQFVSLTSGGAVTLENAGKAEIRGAEADVVWLPMLMTNPGLVIAAGVSYLDSEYTSYPNASGFELGSGLYNFGTGDYSGNEVVRTPTLSGSLGISQTISIADFGELELTSSVYHNSGFYYLAQNSDVSKQRRYHILDASISFLHLKSNVRVTAFGNNLSDSVYASSQMHSDSGVTEYLAPPVNYGLRVNWEY